MKKLILILLLFCGVKAFATNVTIGSGSGAISRTSMGTLTPGDTLFVTQGTYASPGTISNIVGAPGKLIVIMPLGGPNQVMIAASITLRDCKYIVIGYFEISTASTGWIMRGNDNNAGGLTGLSNIFFKNLHFSGISGYAFSNHNNVVYNYTTQDTTTLACYKCKFDSITLDNCGGFLRGSFGTVAAGIDMCMYDTATRILFNNFTSNGSGFVGIQFRSLWAYVTVHQTTYQPYAADQGLFTFGGGGNGFSGTIHDIDIEGPVSTWIARLNGYALFNSTADSILCYNLKATDKSTFGGVVIQSLSSDWIAGKVASCNAAVFNASLGNCPTLNTFWNYTVDIGSGMTAQTVHIKNCIGFNNAFTGKPPGVIIDESSGNPPTYDTSNNKYAVSATALALDSSGTWPTYSPLPQSILLGTGVATPYTTGGQLDLAGNHWETVPSKGPYMGVPSGNFSYITPGNCRSSAGAYNASGQLIRTIWGGRKETGAGVRIGWWDGHDDSGVVPTGGPFTIKVLTNNVIANWDGKIANSSTYQTGIFSLSYMFGDPTTGMDMDYFGTTLYWATGYGEGLSSRWKSTSSDIHSRTSLIGAPNNFTNEFTKTDGTNVYTAWYDGFGGNNNSGVYASSVAFDANVNFSSGSTYKGLSNLAYVVGAIPANEITGLAVQRTHNFIVVTRKGINQVTVSNKTTGALAHTYTTTGAGRCAIDGSDNVWIADATNIKEYSIDGTGNLTATGRTVANANVGGLDINVAGTLMAVCDMATQQVKQYNLSGTLLNTLGTGVSYQTDENVLNNKFYWKDTTLTVYFTFVSYMPDGSILVGDRFNQRVLHFASDFSTFIEAQYYVARGYNMAVDNNNSTRVFLNTLEFSVDYSKAITAPGAWTLVKNWGGRLPFGSNQLQPVTLSNGRTYIMMRGPSFTFYPYELLNNYGLRAAGTGRNFANGYCIDPVDGALIAPTASGGLTYRRYALSSFDGSNNPVWSGSFTGSTITIGATDADQSNGYNSNIVKTTGNNYIMFGQQPATSGARAHLESVPQGSSTPRWKSLYGTDPTYKGPFPQMGQSYDQPRFDNGNSVVNAGGVYGIQDSFIVVGYHGEFWKNAQTNYYWMYHDPTGLPLLLFGRSWSDFPNPVANPVPQNWSIPFATGNALNGTLIKGTDGVLYLYTGEEAIFDGIERMSLTGLNTISTQTAVYPFAGSGAPVINGTDIMVGLTAGNNLANGEGGWTRVPATDYSDVSGNTSTSKGSKSYDRSKSLDLYVSNLINNSGTNVTFTHRVIPTGTRSNSWYIGSDPASQDGSINFEGNTDDPLVAPPYNQGAHLEILDSTNKIIVEFHMAGANGLQDVVANGQVVAADSNNLSVFYARMRFTPLSFTYNSNVLTVTYGQWSKVLTTPFDAGALMDQPYYIRMRFFVVVDQGGGSRVGKQMAIQNMIFNPNFTLPPSLPKGHIKPVANKLVFQH